MALEGDVQRWLDELSAQRRSKYTIKHYGLTLKAFETWFRKELHAKTSLREASPSQLKQYQMWLVTQKKYAKATLYIHLKAIQAFYKHVGSDAARGLRPPRRSQSLPKYLSEAEARALVGACAGHPRDAAVTTLLLYSGLRVGELVGLALNDIDWIEGTVRVRSGKGDKDRLVVVPPPCMTVLKAWLQQRGAAGEYLFPGRGGRGHLGVQSVQRMILRRAQGAGLNKRVTPHVLRHTLATTLLRRGGDIRFIQRILGHSSIATTQVYTHLDDAELKRMYQRATPDFG